MDGYSIKLFVYALLAGLIVSLTHVPLGKRVLQRGIIFIDLAIAQIAALGVLLATGLHLPESALATSMAETLQINVKWINQPFALVFAIAGAMALRWCERRWPDVQEALIGLSFILAASAGFIAISHMANAPEQLNNLLHGQIVFVDGMTLLIAGLASIVLMASWRWWPLSSGYSFYIGFAVAVTISVQLVGIYLVFASLIVPSVAAHFSRWPAYRVGYLVCLVGYSLGIALTFVVDLPTGPVIVWMLALSALVLVLLSRKQPAG